MLAAAIGLLEVPVQDHVVPAIRADQERVAIQDAVRIEPLVQIPDDLGEQLIPSGRASTAQ